MTWTAPEDEVRRKNGSRSGSTIASLVFLALWVLLISSCGYGWNQLPELSKESLTLTQQAENRALSAEGRLRIAQELFQHRHAYEPIIRHPSAAAGDQQTARTLQRFDADSAGAAMHAIAEESLVNGETDKARAIYYSIMTLFADEEYASIRKAAESRLQELDEKEQRKKALR